MPPPAASARQQFAFPLASRAHAHTGRRQKRNYNLKIMKREGEREKCATRKQVCDQTHTQAKFLCFFFGLRSTFSSFFFFCSVAFRIALTKRSNRKSCLFSKDKSRLICVSMWKILDSIFLSFLFFGNYFLNRFTWKAARQRLCGGRVFAVCGRRYWWCFCLTWFRSLVYVYAWLSMLFFFLSSRIFGGSLASLVSVVRLHAYTCNSYTL